MGTSSFPNGKNTKYCSNILQILCSFDLSQA